MTTLSTDHSPTQCLETQGCKVGPRLHVMYGNAFFMLLPMTVPSFRFGVQQELMPRVQSA